MKVLIETDRLLLRRITLDDKEDLFGLHSNPEVQKYTGEAVIESIAEMEEAIERRAKDYDIYGYGRWATFLKDQMQFVGWAGLAYLPEFDEIDIGYRFLPEFWGYGLATEASHAILAYAFDQLKLEKIIAIALPENKASIRVMEKIGMIYDKQAPYDEEIQEAIWYTLDRETYKNK